ncbi:MAG TPA: hypothetical protein VMU43_07425 [Candidatus Acidoferrum sp.]|nr:hypothetical protein [Candidatus Acidoferrum sp.]
MSMETKSPGDPHGHGAAPNGDGYERRDADVRSLLKLGFWLIVTVAVAMVAMRWTFEAYEKAQPRGPMVSPLVQNEEVIPPKPRLQAHPRQELQAFCTDQEQKLDTYGWVDKHAGVVRLPIDRAMQLTLQIGLPTRPADQTSAAAAASELPPDTTAVPPTPYVEGQCGYVVSQIEAVIPKDEGEK